MARRANMQRVYRILICAFLALSLSAQPHPRWSEKAANRWYAQQPWLVGANYIPATAINQLEMWQADTFDPQQIDLELGWAERLGMNTMRVFLHDLLWKQDAAGFKRRIDAFLQIAERHKIKPMLVLFDSCWDPFPQLGLQREPRPGVHNSGWVQGPGAAALEDPTQQPRLKAYVKGVVGAFATDKRVLAWDIWNEPDNTNGGSYAKREPANKVELVQALLPKVFEWARQAHARQPLTSGIWKADASPMEKLQLELSDITSFHNYGSPASFEKSVVALQVYHRPILCTEYMARGHESTFQGILPVAKKYKVAAINWGLVAGKTQTNLPWDSWANPYTDRQPAVWHHEILYPDGKPYRQEEVDFIREITGAKR